MNHVYRWLFLFFCLSVSLQSCDATVETTSDSERFIGTWTLTGATDGRGDLADIIDSEYESVSVIFADDETFVIEVVRTDGNSAKITGGYTIDETDQKLTLVSTDIPDAGELTLLFGYTFDSDTDFTVTMDDATRDTLNSIVGSALTGSVELFFTKKEE